MTLYVVATDNANYLFADQLAAQAYAKEHREAWANQCPGIGYVPIQARQVTRNTLRFVPPTRPEPIITLEWGPGQGKCNRVIRTVTQWWRDYWHWSDSDKPDSLMR
jgi:hypothetical protein